MPVRQGLDAGPLPHPYLTRGRVRPYYEGMNNTATTNTIQQWTFQTRDAVDASGLHAGNPTDARGLRLRLESGYGWVNKNDGYGWCQLEVAARKAECAERAASLVNGYNLAPGLAAAARRR